MLRFNGFYVCWNATQTENTVIHNIFQFFPNNLVRSGGINEDYFPKSNSERRKSEILQDIIRKNYKEYQKQDLNHYSEAKYYSSQWFHYITRFEHELVEGTYLLDTRHSTDDKKPEITIKIDKIGVNGHIGNISVDENAIARFTYKGSLKRDKLDIYNGNLVVTGPKFKFEGKLVRKIYVFVKFL